MLKKLPAIIIALCLAGLSATGCNNSIGNPSADTTAQAETEAASVITNLPKPDMTKWQYIKEEDIFYQTGITYCEKPADESFEKLAFFVPGKYMNSTDNGDGTYTCELNQSAEINGYTAANAPIVMPINSPGYHSEQALDENALDHYLHGTDSIINYTSQGFVFVHSGCRGIEEGAPAGVTDLKAAIRYVRYCDDLIAGDAESIFVYGMSGGGAQAAVLGAAGDSELYEPYLKAIGAVEGLSDSVAGSMDWCPITDLGTANAEYEWMMGCTRPERSDEEQAISDNLARAFADYINGAGFTDKDGNVLTLSESENGIYQAGTYYENIKSVIERSLNNYLSDAEYSADEIRSYIDGLNKKKEWVSYDKSTKTASITSIADFAKECKNASDFLVAFDAPTSQNTLFGYGDGKGSHFDRILADILSSLDSEYAPKYISDLEKTDFVGNTVEQRVKMYSPLYYLMKTEEAYGKSTVAKYWRIRTGIVQINTSLTTEINLALALESNDKVKTVDFETVWNQDHAMAERTGDSVSNFIEWVNACAKG